MKVRSHKPSPAFTIAVFTLLEARRNRLLWLILALLVAGFGLAEFIGEVAITETRQYQSGFLGSLLRASAVFMISLFVITTMVREFNDKGLELVLSLPVARANYYLGKLLGFSAVALLTAFLCGLCLLLYAPAGQVALWSLSLACELLLITALSLLCLFTFNQVTLALSAVMAFYVLARTIVALQLIGHSPLVDSGTFSQEFINSFIDALAFLLPSLHRFADSGWLIYHTGTATDLAPVIVQTTVYMGLLAGAGLFDLYRKNL